MFTKYTFLWFSILIPSLLFSPLNSLLFVVFRLRCSKTGTNEIRKMTLLLYYLTYTPCNGFFSSLIQSRQLTTFNGIRKSSIRFPRESSNSIQFSFLTIGLFVTWSLHTGGLPRCNECVLWGENNNTSTGGVT